MTTIQHLVDELSGDNKQPMVDPRGYVVLCPSLGGLDTEVHVADDTECLTAVQRVPTMGLIWPLTINMFVYVVKYVLKINADELCCHHRTTRVNKYVS